jgi:hypothetical protein
METIDIELNALNAIDKFLLIPLEDANLGEEFDIENETFKVRLGIRPIFLNLFNVYLKQHKSIPEGLSIFDQYDIWLVNYGVSVIKSGGWKKIEQLGLEIRYPSGPEDIKVIIINNMPSTSFKTVATGQLSFNAGIDLTGKVGAKIDEVKIDDFFDLGFNGKLGVSSTMKNSFLIKFDLITANIISTGIGDSQGEWILNKDEQPLLGDQLFSQTILTPKGISSLGAKGRISCVITGPMGSFPVKLKGEWNDLSLLESQS